MRSDDFPLRPHNHTWGEWSVMSAPPPHPQAPPPLTSHFYTTLLNWHIGDINLQGLFIAFNGITVRGKVDLGFTPNTKTISRFLVAPYPHGPRDGERDAIPRATRMYLFNLFIFPFLLNRLELQKAFFLPQHRARCWILKHQVLRCLIELTLLSCLQLSDLFPPLSHRVPAATLEQPHGCLRGDNVKNPRPRTSMTAER